MRSKEVDDAINDLMFIVVTDIYDNEVRIDKTKVINEYNQSVGTVLTYISDLEKENKMWQEYKERLDKLDSKDFIFKQEIRDKIKKLEEDKQTILQAIEEAKESKDEEFLKYNREILYRINGEISVLKELEGE